VDTLIDNLSEIVGPENVLSKPDELLVYECDGLPQHKHRPRAVVFPSSTEETAAIMHELARANVPFTPRGAGTGLSGGALALNSGVVIELARMRKILSIDIENRLAVVQPGVVNLHVSRAVAQLGLYYVPDPSSHTRRARLRLTRNIHRIRGNIRHRNGSHVEVGPDAAGRSHAARRVS